ncbi:MAG: hypothetical protein AB2A00_02220 [Myxococcota bacterium]
MKMHVKWTLIPVLLTWFPSSAAAYSVYPARIPNGTVNSCTNCHVTALGGGPRTSFGDQSREHRTGGYPDWAALYNLDADNDGFTNGEELGDPCGRWTYGQTPEHTEGITKPGDALQFPATHTNQDCAPASSSSSGSSSASSSSSSSSGSSSSGGGTSSSSSSASSSGSSSGGRTPCDDYCDTVMENCTGANQQYEQRDICWLGCQYVMAAGQAGDQTGNSLACRSYHAQAAASDPATHCEHAGPGGGGVCGNPCDYYCDLVAVACSGTNAIYADRVACLSTCADFPEEGSPAATESDNVFCRIYFATGALEASRLFCPAASQDSTFCDEPVPGSSGSSSSSGGTGDDEPPPDDGNNCSASHVPSQGAPVGLLLMVWLGVTAWRRKR